MIFFVMPTCIFNKLTTLFNGLSFGKKLRNGANFQRFFLIFGDVGIKFGKLYGKFG